MYPMERVFRVSLVYYCAAVIYDEVRWHARCEVIYLVQGGWFADAVGGGRQYSTKAVSE